MSLVGKVNGVTYMLPFYNYSMGIIYRKDLLDDPKEQAAFKAKYGIDLKLPTTWDEYKKQVEFFSRDTDGDGKIDFYGTVNQGQRGDCISMQWSNYLYANGGQYHDANWRSEEHTSELQSPYDLVCRLLLEKKKKKKIT